MKPQSLIIAITIFIITSVHAHEHKANNTHKKHTHEAHVHGEAELNIAFDNLKGVIEFTSPAESVLGFEHQAKSSEDKKKLANSVQIFKDKINEMIKFDSSLACKIESEKIEQVVQKKSKHSDFLARYKVVCDKAIEHSSLDIDFSIFDHINKMNITLLVGTLQKSVEYKKGDKLNIELK